MANSVPCIRARVIVSSLGFDCHTRAAAARGGLAGTRRRARAVRRGGDIVLHTQLRWSCPGTLVPVAGAGAETARAEVVEEAARAEVEEAARAEAEDAARVEAEEAAR